MEKKIHLAKLFLSFPFKVSTRQLESAFVGELACAGAAITSPNVIVIIFIIFIILFLYLLI